MDALKNIIERLNKLFKSDYNVSSFDAIRGNGLLLIVIKVLKEFKMLENEEDLSNLPSIILTVLNAIKYAPENRTPEEFKSGVSNATKSIVHPILTFLLENEQNIKKRYYLSKYVNQIEVPGDFIASDAQLQNVYQQYQDTIDKFWMVYSENIQEQGIAKENLELEDDVCQMKKELSSLEKRINAQSKKTDFSQSTLNDIHDFVQERKKHEKLTKQLEADNLSVQEYTESIRVYNRRDITTSLEDLFEKSEYYANSQQVYERSLKEIQADLEITEEVSTDTFDNDLDQLEAQQYLLQESVNKLNREKQQDDAISAMQNQQKILSKKKALLSKQVIKIRLNNEQVLNKAEELSQILEGDVLRGRQFRNYVNDLKLMSYTYKKSQGHVRALIKEETMLKQTLTVLHGLEPKLQENILKKCDDTPDEIKDLTLDEIKFRAMKLFKEQDALLKTCYEEERKNQRVKDVYSDYLIQYDAAKHAFDEESGHVNDQIDQVMKESEDLQELLKLEEEDLQTHVQESEMLQDSVLRYSQMFIDNAGNTSTEDILKDKLQAAQEVLDDLRKQSDMKQQAQFAFESEKAKLQSVILLITEGKVKI